MTWRRLRRARATPWTPYLIPRSLMYGWLDAEKAYTITQSGGLVSSWVDIITGTALVQATGASQPAYSATGFNGHPCLTFDGTADNLAYTAGAIAWPNSGPFEVWALVDQSVPSGIRQIVGWPNSGISGINIGQNASLVPTAFLGTGAATVSVSALSAFTGLGLVRVRYDGTNATTYLNGIPGISAAVAVSASGATRYRIGASAGSSAVQFWPGNINSILITRLLDTATATQLSAYLNARRGA